MPIKTFFRPSRLIQRKENYLFLGISLYTLGLLLPMFRTISYVGAGFCLLGLFLMIASFNKLPLSCLPKNKNFLFVFKLYMIWSALIFFRGIFDLESVRGLIFYFIEYKFGFIPFIIVPGVVMFGTNVQFYKKLFNWIYIYAIVFIVMGMVFLMPIVNSAFSSSNIIEYTSWVEFLTKSLYLPSSFVLLTFLFQKRKIQITSIVAFSLALIVSIFFARRNLIFSIGLAGIFTLILYGFSRLGAKRRFWFIIVLIAFLGITYDYVSKSLYQDKFQYMESRLEQDLFSSREGVQKAMTKDFANSPLDYIWGRGGNGSYYINSELSELDGNQRRSMETGYLAMILKGGVIYLILHLLILFPAVYKGLFQSNNMLTKAGALFILIAILELGPAGCNRATLYSLMSWLFVGMCYSREIRELDNKTIIAIITN